MSEPDARISVTEALAFLCELAMLATLVVAGWQLGSGPDRLVLAIALPVVVAGVWGIWLAPTSRRRLVDPPRLILQIALFAGTGLSIAVAGYFVWGLLFFVVASAVFGLTRLGRGVTGADSPPR